MAAGSMNFPTRIYTQMTYLIFKRAISYEKYLIDIHTPLIDMQII